MIPYDKLTIVRNRHRVRDLRVFRELVEAYFEGSEYATDNLPVDWEGARRARSQINRMLPRMMQVVHAAQLDAQATGDAGGGPAVADVRVLRNIFGARYADGSGQEVLDVIDMAIGVYDASRYNALLRTVNPLHYAVTVLAYVARIPGRAFSTVFGGTRRSRLHDLRAEEIARLESAVSRLGNVEELIEMRFAEMRDRQARQHAHNSDQLVDLAERMDFAERVIAQQRSIDRLKPPRENGAATPV